VFSGISVKHLLATAGGTVLAVLISFAILSPSQVLAQQPGQDSGSVPPSQQPSAAPQADQDNMGRPVAQQPENNMQEQREDDMEHQRENDRVDQNSSAVRAKDRDGHGQIAVFHDFLDSHPEIRRELSSDPNRIEERSYVNTRPSLKLFLENHPDLADAVRQNPEVLRKFDPRRQ